MFVQLIIFLFLLYATVANTVNYDFWRVHTTIIVFLAKDGSDAHKVRLEIVLTVTKFAQHRRAITKKPNQSEKFRRYSKDSTQIGATRKFNELTNYNILSLEHTLK